MHSTEGREKTLWPHSPASTARFRSKHLNKWGSSHLKSNSSHRHLLSGLPPAAGMCTFDSPRSLKGCKGTAENDHRLRAQWIEHGLCSFVNLKRHCQDLKVKNWTKHASFLSDRENLIKALRIWEKTATCLFVKVTGCGARKAFVFVLPRAWEAPSRGSLGAHLLKLTLWNSSISSSYGFYFNADRIISNICATAKRQRQKKKRKKEKKQSSVCQGEADNFWRGEIHFRACEWESQTKVNLQDWKKSVASHIKT